MRTSWHTTWAGSDIVVHRDGVEVDRLHTPDLKRIIFVYRSVGLGPIASSYALAELSDDCVLLPEGCGIAGRVHFERQAWWAERGCVYWVPARAAVLPAALRPTAWWLRPHAVPGYRRVPRAELAEALAGWPIEGPQTWQERKWDRIERSRPFADSPIHQRTPAEPGRNPRARP